MQSTAELRVVRGTRPEIRGGAGGKRKICGYAAVFGKLSHDLGGFREKIDKKAFDDAVKRCDVRGLKNHESAMLLGRTKSGTMRLSVDDVGLYYEIDAPDTQVGRDTLVEIERGDLDGSSFSFTTDSDKWDDATSPPTRTLLKVRDLFDCGPVTFAAYPDATTSARAYELARATRAAGGGTSQGWNEARAIENIMNAYERGVIKARTVVDLRHQAREHTQRLYRQRVRLAGLKLAIGR
jgi:uncharacterized protein